MKDSLVAVAAFLALSTGVVAQPASSGSTTASGQSTQQIIESGASKNPGLGQDKPKEQTSVSESNAVGSLGANADQKSMPPAMMKDCQKNPAECSEPLTTGAAQQPPLPQQSK